MDRGVCFVERDVFVVTFAVHESGNSEGQLSFLNLIVDVDGKIMHRK